VFAIPGVAVVLPVLGVVSDAFGIQASVLVLVPVSVAAGLLLASAARFVAADINSIRHESVARVSGLEIAAVAS
jgi:fucose permease